MRVLIIEDELLAQQKLQALLSAIDQQVIVLATLTRVKDALKWLAHHPPPDLAFVDIQLSDDHSFEIFRKFQVSFPVIFTTAYDKYLLESFEFNSIDYLLKPITEEKLRRSLDKMKSLERHFLQGNLINLIHQQDQPAKSRIVARKGTEFVVMELSAVAYFYSEHKIVFARDFGGRKLMVDKTLSELEKELDKNRFFRINRKYIAQLPAIDRFKPENGKIRIYLTPEMPEEIHISKETAPFFRTWLGEGQA